MQQFNLKAMTLRDLWQIFRRRMWVIILPLITVVAVAVPGSFLLTPQYRASALMVSGEIDESQILEGLGAIPLRPQERLRMVEQKIRSRKYTNEIFEKAKLEEYLSQKMGKPLTDDDRKRYMNRIVDIKYRGGNMVEIIATHSDPDMAMNIANAVANVYVDKAIQRQQRAISKSFSFITSQLEKYKKKLEQSEMELLEAQKRGVLGTLDKDNAALVEKLSKWDTDLVELDLQLQEAQEQLRQAKSRLQTGAVRSFGYLDENILRLKSELTALKTQLKEYSLKYSDEWPAVKKLKVDIMQKEEELRRAGSKIGGNKSDDTNAVVEYWQEKVKTLTIQKVTLQNKIDEENRKLQQLPQRQLDLARLQREKAANENVYTMLLQRLNQAQMLQETTKLSDVASIPEVFDTATKPQIPIKPNKKKIAFLAVVLGLMLGGGTAFILEYFDHSFHTVDELEEYTKFDVLGTIPKLATYEGELKAKRNKRMKIAGAVVGGLIISLLIVDFINFRFISHNSQFLDIAQKTLNFLKQRINEFKH